MVKFLVSKGATELNTALAWSAEEGHLDVVKFLVSKKGSTLCSTDPPFEHQPLCLSAEEGKVEVVRFLLKSGAESIPNEIKSEALSSAIEGAYIDYIRDEDRIEVIGLLLACTLDVNLRWARGNLNSEAMRALIELLSADHRFKRFLEQVKESFMPKESKKEIILNLMEFRRVIKR